MGRAETLGQVDLQDVNLYGGSLAYGHPFAATGGRLIMNLLMGLEERKSQFGLATACAAGGLGSAMVIEKNNN